MSLAKTQNKGGEGKRALALFEEGRALHVGIGILTLISGFALLFYIVSCMGSLLTSTSVDPALVLMPAIWIGSCIAAGWGLSAYKAMTLPLRGNYANLRVVKICGIVGMGVAVSIVIMLAASILAGPDAPGFSGFALILVVACIVLLCVCWIGLFCAANIRDPEAPREKRPLDDLNAPMSFRTLFRRAFTYCGRNYGSLLVLFFGIYVIARIAYVLCMSPWFASLLADREYLMVWATRNDYIAGIPLPGDIQSRYQSFTPLNYLFDYTQNVFKSSFHYAALGIGIAIVMRSYHGGDSRLSEAAKRSRGQLGQLVLISVLFSAFYQLGLLILFVPGLIFYTYCIFAFPNLLFVGKYKALQNFGEAKNRVSGNFARAILYAVILYFIQFAYQLAMQPLLNGIIEGVGGKVLVGQFQADPLGQFGNLLLLEFLTGSLLTFIAPLEAALVAILFFDLEARKRAKVLETMKSPSGKDRAKSLSTSSLLDRTQRARYCPRCGLSVRKGITRCPNCKADVPLEEPLG